MNSSNDISKTYGRWGLVTFVDVCEGRKGPFGNQVSHSGVHSETPIRKLYPPFGNQFPHSETPIQKPVPPFRNQFPHSETAIQKPVSPFRNGWYGTVWYSMARGAVGTARLVRCATVWRGWCGWYGTVGTVWYGMARLGRYGAVGAVGTVRLVRYGTVRRGWCSMVRLVRCGRVLGSRP